MKIDSILVSSNVCGHYLDLYPLVFRTWYDKFNIRCYLILIADKIPDNLKHLSDYIILFEPIPNLNDIYVAQVIRILYPALMKGNVLISDVDIFPISKKYFIDSLEDIDENKFITFTDRYVKQNMYAICYNVANSNIWRDIFKINNKNDIVIKLKEWYNESFDGTKNCNGWFTDQLMLYKYTNKWNKETNNLIILEDKKLGFNRLDKRERNKIVKEFDKYKSDIGNYTDFHCIKPYSKLKLYIKQLVNEIRKI
ncbi:MAG: hypothetical protein CMF62_02020 [Magnetococcales bacterium]|nr:hypothetical protein [Magnetococcales bacterium]|tara:strand:+ start:138042 stop:138800 length:759 start_codon:yes stop_codon:yes gene_type:complete